MTKSIAFITLFFVSAYFLYAQEEMPITGRESIKKNDKKISANVGDNDFESPPIKISVFDPNRIFVGGGLGGIGIGGGGFGGTISPEIGYTLLKFLDAGIVANIAYSKGADAYSNSKYETTSYGFGGYLRAYPVSSFFLTVEPESNWTNQTGTGYYGSSVSQATSFLAGVGYGSRTIGKTNFYTSILFDLINQPTSPYYVGGNIGFTIKVGFCYYLFQSRKE